MTIAQTKSVLRKQLRHARKQLTAEQQSHAARNLNNVLKSVIGLRRNARIALYTAMDGEIDLTPFIRSCRDKNIDLYLPVLHGFNHSLWFAKYDDDSPMFANRFGIPEPLKSDPIRPWQLTAVLLPLVGFDAQGGRLGMGGGFYDRTFAHAYRWPKKPALYGIAHECQKLEHVPTEAWDIPLDGVISDRKVYLNR